jgi:HAE1 family hydrophobic/amphiphilic exporter-1
MYISELCTKRPVFASVVNLIIILLGLLSYSRLEIRESPNIDNPVIMVTSLFVGADASYMEKNVTNVLEQRLRSIKNLDHFSSTSSDGKSAISMIFNIDADMNEAMTDITSQISQAKPYLPSDMDPPQASQVNADNFPVMWLAVSSIQHTSLQLTNIISNQLLPALQRIPSVGSATIYGGSDYSIQIEPIPLKLYALKLAPLDLVRAVQSQNQDFPAGVLETESKNFVLKLKGSLSSAEDFQNIIISYNNGQLVRLKDVANVSLKAQEATTIFRYNDKNSIAIGIVKQSSASSLDLVKEVYALLEKTDNTLPKGIKVDVALNGSESLQQSVDAVFRSIFEALVLVGVVVYLFLGSWRLALVPFVAIPVSLIGSLILIKACGFSINIFSLLAMVLAIGLVVDDAIVMLENIYRHYEEGMTANDATLKAIKEITSAIIAMTITLAAVFLPIGFIQGFLGKLFIEFAWTLAFCVLVSGFVALTFTPMLCSRLIGANHNISFVSAQFNKFVYYVEEIYIKYIHIMLHNKMRFAFIIIGSITLLVLCYSYIDKSFSPIEDVGYFQIKMTGPDGATLQQTDVALKKVEAALKEVNDIAGYLSIGGWGGSANAGFVFVKLKDFAVRENKQQQTVSDLNKILKSIPEMNITAINPTSIFANATYDIEFDLKSTDFTLLNQSAVMFVQNLTQSPVFQGPDKQISATIPFLSFIIDREKAYNYQVDFQNIGDTIKYALAGYNIGTFNLLGEIYNCYIQYGLSDRNQLEDISKVYLKSSSGKMFAVTNFAKLSQGVGPQSYTHYNGDNSIRIFSGLSNGATLTDAIKNITKIAQDNLTQSVTLEFRGQIERLQQNNSQIITTFLLALLFIYLVLCAQFESFKDPLIILCSVPFSITGALVALYLAGNNLNIYSNIGVVTLIGLITKNALMIIEFANQILDEHKMSFEEAIIASCRLRFRPILMTTMATIFGAIPFVTATGAGSEARNSIGLTIVGGMSVGTLFTFFVIPLLYYMFSSRKKMQ